MKKILVAALMVVLAAPAFAAVQNVKVSGDITASYVDRNDFNLGMTSVGALGNADDTGLKSQSMFLTQTRLRVDADLTDNVSTAVGLINERVWNAENNSDANTNYANDTNVQLYLATVTLREFLYSPLTVTVGRQAFIYGNGLVLGNGPASQGSGPLQYVAQDLNLRAANDGVKVVLDYKPLTIDLIYFKSQQSVQSIRGLAGLRSGQSSSVYGYNLNYQLNDAWNTVVEQYLFSSIIGKGCLNNCDSIGIAGENKGNKLYVPGLRASTNPIKGLNIQGELAFQAGDQNVKQNNKVAAEPVRAMAAQVMASYSLPILTKYKPTLNMSYTYLSGDKRQYENYSASGDKDAKHFTAWSPLEGSIGSGTIYGTLYPMSNLNILSGGASVSPLEDVTASFTWSNLWAADSYNTNNPLLIFQPNEGTGVLNPATKTTGERGLGNEYDVNVKYNYTEDVSFGVTVGWYVPGDALSNLNRDTASQAIADVAVKF
ncbi:MAG: alginate export family protein [Candidatus Omnitrophica bacterium]|nr:alginate export family protein [Candidatus Omnitrophota bacterium]